MLDVLTRPIESGWGLELLEILGGASLRVTVLLALAAGLAVALRRASAARRHLVWTVAVLLALAMPFLPAAAPDLDVPLPSVELPAGWSFAASTDVAPTSDGTDLQPGEAMVQESREPLALPAGPPPEATEARRSTEPPPEADRSGPVAASARLEAERSSAGADPVSIERAYAAAGLGGRDRAAGLGLLTDELELRTGAVEMRVGALETRVEGLERRVAALETLPGRLTPSRGDPDSDRPLRGGLDEAPRIAGGGLASGGGGPGARGGPSAPEGAGPVAFLLGLWATGLVGVLGALSLSVARLAWLRRSCAPIETGRVAAAADQVASRIGLWRRPVLLRGDDTTMPMTWGVRRSFVLLPAGVEEWERWRLEAVLLHEFAHVGRRDYLAQLASRLACALYWFHPLVWIASHRLRVEREHACDDVVVSAGTDPSRYARGLVEVARSLRVGPSMAGAGLAIARSNRLRDRLLALLDGERDRRPLTARRVVAGWVVGLALVIPLAGIGPASGEAGAEGAPTPTPTATVAAERVPTPTPMTTVASEETVAPAGVPNLGSARVAWQAGRATGLDLSVVPEVPLSAPPFRAQEATPLCGPADGEMERSSHNRNDDLLVIETRYGNCAASVRIEGEIRFTEDFGAIAALSSRGLLRLEVSRDGDRRRLEVRSGDGGRPEYRWWVDGDERPFDETAERWLEVALLDLFRTTGWKADERAAFILEQEGPEGVLAEASRARTDHARARYLQALVERGRLTGVQVRRVIELAATEIDSDHWLAGILAAVADRYEFDRSLRTAFIRAAASLESDHHQANALSTALSRHDLDGEHLEALLEQVARGIESDHHVARILTQLAERYPLDPELRDPFLRAAATLDSDHHRANVYGTVLGQRGLSASELATVLRAAREMESDHHLASLLMRAAEHDLSDATLRGAFLEAAGSIESSHHRRNVLGAALRLEGLSSEDVATILSAAGGIGSDHHVAGLLTEIAGRDLDPTKQRAYLEAASRIESDHHLSRALAALVDRRDLRPEELVLALRTAREIGSDHQLSEFLLRVAARHPVEGEVRDEFLRALGTIESEHHHGRVASRLLAGGG